MFAVGSRGIPPNIRRACLRTILHSPSSNRIEIVPPQLKHARRRPPCPVYSSAPSFLLHSFAWSPPFLRQTWRDDSPSRRYQLPRYHPSNPSHSLPALHIVNRRRQSTGAAVPTAMPTQVSNRLRQVETVLTRSSVSADLVFSFLSTLYCIVEHPVLLVSASSRN